MALINRFIKFQAKVQQYFPLQNLPFCNVFFVLFCLVFNSEECINAVLEGSSFAIEWDPQQTQANVCNV